MVDILLIISNDITKKLYFSKNLDSELINNLCNVTYLYCN